MNVYVKTMQILSRFKVWLSLKTPQIVLIHTKGQRDQIVNPRILTWRAWLLAIPWASLSRKTQYSATTPKQHSRRKIGICHVLWTWRPNFYKKQTNHSPILNCKKTFLMHLLTTMLKRILKTTSKLIQKTSK